MNMKMTSALFLTCVIALISSAKAGVIASTQAAVGITASPFIITSTSVDVSTNGINFNKEDFKNVEADAYNFIAGEPMTRALEEQVNKAREIEQSLAEATEQEVVIEIIKIINE